MNSKIWVLGSSNVDMTYKVKEIPVKGSTIQAESCVKGSGGKGANQAIAAAIWGVDTFLIGAVGDDENGQLLINVLKSWNVNTDYVSVVKNIPSGNAIIFVDNEGANCITVYPGANQYLTCDNCPDFGTNDLLIAQFEVNIDSIEFFFDYAKKRGAYTILNPSPVRSISKFLLESTDMIVANEIEAYELGGITVDTPQKAKECGKKIIKSGPETVLITLGKMGVVVVTDEHTVYIPGYPVKVIDTQGAGDVFLGTFAAMLCKGKSLENAAQYANVVAALSVTKKGSTQVSLPSINISDKEVANLTSIIL